LDIDPGGIVAIFAKKQEKKLFPKEIIKKKRKKPGGGSKIRNKSCIKNEVFHVYALNKPRRPSSRKFLRNLFIRPKYKYQETYLRDPKATKFLWNLTIRLRCQDVPLELVYRV
jgi:hypothetical protein